MKKWRNMRKLIFRIVVGVSIVWQVVGQNIRVGKEKVEGRFPSSSWTGRFQEKKRQGKH